MLCDVVRRRRRRWAHAPVIHAASHFDDKERVAWVPIYMHTRGSFFYNYGTPLKSFGGGADTRVAKPQVESHGVELVASLRYFFRLRARLQYRSPLASGGSAAKNFISTRAYFTASYAHITSELLVCLLCLNEFSSHDIVLHTK